MDFANHTPLDGAEIHGFHTTADLDTEKLMGDASVRWFRPNEVHAILSNYRLFKIQPQPVEAPTSGRVLLFDRKMLRNFRKDGHNWRKKKDGRTVQEAHEKLKIGNEERIHVYYARSEDDPNFYRRCYWLLDKDLERIVLVHYRLTPEDNAIQQPLLPIERTEPSFSGSTHSDMSTSAVLTEEINSREEYFNYSGLLQGHVVSQAKKADELRNHQLSLHEINTLDWADLLEEPACTDLTTCREGDASTFEQHTPYQLQTSHSDVFLQSNGPLGVTSSAYPANASLFAASNGGKETSTNEQAMGDQQHPSSLSTTILSNYQNPEDILNTMDAVQNANSFGHGDPICSLGDLQLDNTKLNGHRTGAVTTTNHSLTGEQIFIISDISPSWAYSTEETKVLVIGRFQESQRDLMESKIYCIIGGRCVPVELVQAGVYQFTALPHTPGSVNLYLTLDGHAPISQVLSFDYRQASQIELNSGVTLSGIESDKFKQKDIENDKFKQKEFELQMRLAHLLFSTTNNISILSTRIASRTLQEAKRFASLTSVSLAKDWMQMSKSRGDNETTFLPTSKDFFELVLKNKMQEWLLLKIAEGCKTTSHDSQGQGVIHLSTILNYIWAVPLFVVSGMSLDFRDAFGWTALHWAAYCGREKMVAALLSAGANPSLVTHPTPEFPGGCTAADLAYQGGYEGLAAYLAEKGLTAHFKAMTLSGNATAAMPSGSINSVKSKNSYPENLSEQELCLKESLAAYRNAAEAADSIQAAFRERTLKIQTKAVQLVKPGVEAGNTVAALKIQQAYRNYNRKKLMVAAGRIQGHFRTWQARKFFLLMRKQATKIQAAFRGYKARKSYVKIIWSVGVLEKAVLRWRLKRKGLRGLQPNDEVEMVVDKGEENLIEEDFFRIGREQAEERVTRSVVRVQAMFRSYQAQQEYRRMKLAHEQAKLEFNELLDTDQHERVVL